MILVNIIYLMRNKWESFKNFKFSKIKYKTKLVKNIKILQYNQTREYLSQEFYDYLREYEIASQTHSTSTPQ